MLPPSLFFFSWDLLLTLKCGSLVLANLDTVFVLHSLLIKLHRSSFECMKQLQSPANLEWDTGCLSVWQTGSMDKVPAGLLLLLKAIYSSWNPVLCSSACVKKLRYFYCVLHTWQFVFVCSAQSAAVLLLCSDTQVCSNKSPCARIALDAHFVPEISAMHENGSCHSPNSLVFVQLNYWAWYCISCGRQA